MKDIPLIYIHNSYSPYLRPVLAQSRAFNKDVDIFFLGDEDNQKVPYARHYLAKQYSSTAEEFKKVYVHMSTNPYEFELYCFQRWFIINEFAAEMGLEHFLCLDSDVLLFCNVKEIFNKYLNFDFSICGGYSPHVTLFNKRSLDNFCAYLTELYTNPEYLQRLAQRYQHYRENNISGGNCDMTAFYYYQTDISDNIKELTTISDNSCFDQNILDSDGFEMNNGFKEVYWKDGLPYCKFLDTGDHVRFYCFHFQGRAKSHISNFAKCGYIKRHVLFKPINWLQRIFMKY